MSFGGTMIVHDAVRLDYCVDIALRSLAQICDEVIVVEAESTDHTRDILDAVKHDYDQITIISMPWTPSRNGEWLSALTNEARMRLKSDTHISLQADEVLDISERALIRNLEPGRGYMLRRLNFWFDHKHLLPANRVCSSWVVRIAPQAWPSYGDAEGLLPCGPTGICNAHIYHYGFLRHAKPLASKIRECTESFFGVIDPIHLDVENRGAEALIDPKHNTAVTMKELAPFTGSHPDITHQWLSDRGFKL